MLVSCFVYTDNSNEITIFQSFFDNFRYFQFDLMSFCFKEQKFETKNIFLDIFFITVSVYLHPEKRKNTIKISFEKEMVHNLSECNEGRGYRLIPTKCIMVNNYNCFVQNNFFRKYKWKQTFLPNQVTVYRYIFQPQPLQ